MIYTCTLNPSLDYFVTMDTFIRGQLNRISSSQKTPGGKGINVSRVLNRLGVKSRAIGFLGGFTGEYIRNFLSKEAIDTDFVDIDGDTRINVKINSEEETEINGLSPVISDNQLKILLTKIENLNENDILVLSGSIPQSLSENSYQKICEQTNHYHVKTVVDTTGRALIETLRYKPFLIKPNQQELEEIFDKKLSNLKEIIECSRTLIKKGAENVIVSMGENGAVFVNNDFVYTADVPKGIVKNSVGSGDSLIAGFLAKYVESGNLLASFKNGVASGSATAFSYDLCQLEDIEQLISEVKIIKRDYLNL